MTIEQLKLEHIAAHRVSVDTIKHVEGLLKTEKAIAKKYRKALVDLTSAVRSSLAALDRVMEATSTPERGKQVAAISNQLEMANDKARYFGLGVDFRTDKKSK